MMIPFRAHCLAILLPLAVSGSIYLLYSADFGDFDFANVTQSEYEREVGNQDIVLLNASSVYCRHRPTRDGYDRWLRANVPVASYQKMKNTRIAEMETRGWIFAKDRDGQELNCRRASTLTPLKNWLAPRCSEPRWWKESGLSNQLEINAWEVWEASGRAKGELWIYDFVSEILRIWKWNQQYLSRYD